ncbi:hypothetical protein BpHYR1_008034 [Brachionus plicatilis]|uniref:Uncharacterized protein n=1 Tax=Brachionus plicatilis TaxID=10195 RepID=A0A3M7SZF5_BRAPC|nr:hypothetical protein BpHYR1_008034 [Brachionus plicatilis]
MSNLNQKKRKCISLETKLNFDKYVYVSIVSNFPERGLLSDVEIISSVNNTAQNDDISVSIPDTIKLRNFGITNQRFKWIAWFITIKFLLNKSYN